MVIISRIASSSSTTNIEWRYLSGANGSEFMILFFGPVWPGPQSLYRLFWLNTQEKKPSAFKTGF
jgi:hypothetical protein